MTVPCAAALATAAHAQLDPIRDPGATTGVDTGVAPTPKNPPKGLFTRVAGAEYKGRSARPEYVPADSPTPFEADLRAVRFRGAKLGFAGGTIQQGIERHPVMYRYTDLHGWQRDESLEISGRGYVSAIAWIDDERALAVGGDGAYPDRETDDGTSSCASGEDPSKNEAGMARAWLYEHGDGWRELTNLTAGEDGSPQDEIPDQMTALTAADFYVAPPASPVEFGAVGGLCQIWHWKDGGFHRSESGEFAPAHYTETSSAARFRVRSIAFARNAPGVPASQRRLAAFAVTSGCCRAGETEQQMGAPQTLRFKPPPSETQHAANGTWEQFGSSPDQASAQVPNGYVSATVTLAETSEADPSVQLKGPGRILSPVGPEAPYEPASSIDRAGGAGQAPSEPPRSVGVTSVRLASGAGDISGSGRPRAGTTTVPFSASDRSVLDVSIDSRGVALTKLTTDARVGGHQLRGPDGIPDWAVGVAGSSDRGIAYATDPRQIPGWSEDPDRVDVLGCFDAGIEPDMGLCVERNSDLPLRAIDRLSDASPTAEIDQRRAAAASSDRLLSLPTYGLHAIDVLASGEEGWAVGEHGAIVKLSTDSGATRKSASSGHTAERAAPVPDASPFEQTSPTPNAEAGHLPGLTERPIQRDTVPALHPSDAPMPAVLSRDGRDGLAIQSGELAAYMAEGVWHRCDTDAGRDDPRHLHAVCRSWREMSRKGIQFAQYVAPARIPLERDDDPTNDGDFEVVAATRSVEAPLIRLRDGRWGVKERAELAELIGENLDRSQASTLEPGLTRNHWRLAFTAPDDGLLISGFPAADGSRAKQYLFDGKRWSECARSCDPGERLPRYLGSTLSQWIRGLTVSGDRMYLYGFRTVGMRFPLIVYRERGGPWNSHPVSGEYDPGFRRRSLPWVGSVTTRGGDVFGLTIARGEDGGYEGWAVGEFNRPRVQNTALGLATFGRGQEDPEAQHAIARLRSDGSINFELADGALPDAIASKAIAMDSAALHTLQDVRSEHLSSRAPAPEQKMVFQTANRLFEFNLHRDRWEAIDTNIRPRDFRMSREGRFKAISPDGRGGFYAELTAGGEPYRYHYTDEPREPVFKEVPRPSPHQRGQPLTAVAADRAGRLWAATESDTLYRYIRSAGWSRVRIPGWDPGRVVTAPSEAHAIATGPDGIGLVVGKGGRIARFSPHSVALDPAAEQICDRIDPTPPCGTSHTLRSVAIAPDGAAIVGGDRASLLWRPPEGELRSIPAPERVDRTATFASVSIASRDRVWVGTDRGVFEGRLVNGRWSWRVENEGEERNPSPRISHFAIGSAGEGFGIHGSSIYERRPGETPLWKERVNPIPHTLTAIALVPGGKGGALVGGEGGLILTRTPEGFEVARPPEYPSHASNPIGSVAAIPGVRPGQLEAWAVAVEPSPHTLLGDLGVTAADRVGTGALLHATNASDESLLDPTGRAPALPDAPAPREDELSIAAFGKTECQVGIVQDRRCEGFWGEPEFAELIAKRTVAELAERSKSRGGPVMALFTGDAVDGAGYPGNQAMESAGARGANEGLHGEFFAFTGARGPSKMRRWGEAVADKLTDAGMPLFGAIGGLDLSEVTECLGAGWPDPNNCTKHKSLVKPGENLTWRQTMLDRSKPWGGGPEVESDLRFRPVGSSVYSKELRDQASSAPGMEVDAEGVSDVSTHGTKAKLATGGAPTHYAIDVIDGSKRLARLVFVDNSLGSLAASDPIQQPIEADGQTGWLQRMLCIRTPATTANCTRRPDQRAIVVSNAPTYTYAGEGASEVAADAQAFESILVANKADLVVSGRIGWNGLYWTFGPGLHEPCPGQSYPTGPPRGAAPTCGSPLSTEGPTAAANALLPDSARSTAPPPPPVVDEIADAAPSADRPIPFVVASGGGGKFAASRDAMAFDARDGFWHGYTIARLDASGDPRKTIVEQRPIYDWVGIEAAERVLRPGQKMRLRGFARGPIGYMEEATNGSYQSSSQPLVRYDRIEGPEITHRYDLVEADPKRPWVAKLDSDGKPTILDPAIATIDAQTGQIRVGRGNQPRTFAIGTLSVGKHVASYPLVFEPRRSFRPTATAPPPQYQRVLVQSAVAGITPPANPGAPPQIGSVSPPVLPSFPSVPPPPAVPPTAQPQPTPPPPAPPPPPPPASLQLAAAPPGLTVAPPSSVIPPPAPPINPAPPGGARKEARQRQAATEKSGSDSGESSGSGNEVDTAEAPYGPTGTAMTRRDRVKASPSFTAVSRRDQASAWARGTLYGGGLTLAALALGAGWWTARPRPRPPVVPAPARARIRQ